jgi:hypothetical protein
MREAGFELLWWGIEKMTGKNGRMKGGKEFGCLGE